MTDQEQPDEIDKLLEEAKKPEQPDPFKKAVTDKLETIEAEMKSQRAEKTQNDVNAAVDALSEKIPKAFKENPMFSRDALEDYLTRQAEQDEAFKGAFLGRHKDPASWQKAQSSLVESFATKFESLPDPGLTEDREAALASAKETKPADTDEFDEKAVGDMSTQEFNEFQRKLGVDPYGG